MISNKEIKDKILFQIYVIYSDRQVFGGEFFYLPFHIGEISLATHVKPQRKFSNKSFSVIFNDIYIYMYIYI